MKKIIDGKTDAGKAYPVQPRNISVEDHFWDAFGNNETEVSARVIVRFCQEREEWVPFTKEQIDTFSKHNFHFNRLCDGGDKKSQDNFVILGEDDRYRVTHEFIAACFKSSPAA